jgi:hypothetical protein
MLIAQVLQSEQIDKLLKIKQEHSRQIESERTQPKEMDAALDKRMNDLVLAIRNLIARIPPTALA